MNLYCISIPNCLSAGPKVNSTLNNTATYVLYTGSVTLDCHDFVLEDNDPVQYVWVMPSGQPVFHRELVLQSSSLQSGSYTCKVFNSAGDESVVHRVEVQGNA